MGRPSAFEHCKFCKASIEIRRSGPAALCRGGTSRNCHEKCDNGHRSGRGADSSLTQSPRLGARITAHPRRRDPHSIAAAHLISDRSMRYLFRISEISLRRSIPQRTNRSDSWKTIALPPRSKQESAALLEKSYCNPLGHADTRRREGHVSVMQEPGVLPSLAARAVEQTMPFRSGKPDAPKAAGSSRRET